MLTDPSNTTASESSVKVIKPWAVLWLANVCICLVFALLQARFVRIARMARLAKKLNAEVLI